MSRVGCSNLACPPNNSSSSNNKINSSNSSSKLPPPVDGASGDLLPALITEAVTGVV